MCKNEIYFIIEVGIPYIYAESFNFTIINIYTLLLIGETINLKCVVKCLQYAKQSLQMNQKCN